MKTLTILILFFALSCSTVKYNDEKFLKSNLESFREIKLDNGIPVYIKLNPRSPIWSLKLLVGGGYAGTDVPGLEQVMYSTLEYASGKYSNRQKRKMLFTTRSSIWSSTSSEMTIVSLELINKNFDKIFDLYASLVLQPRFKKEHYREVIKNKKISIEHGLKQGNVRVSKFLNDYVFKDHPYKRNYLEKKDIDKISYRMMRKHYDRRMQASNMRFFAVGGYDVEALKKKLNRTFGKLPVKKQDTVSRPPVIAPPPKTLLLDSFPDVKKETGYVKCSFKAPNPAHKAYLSLQMAMDMLRDLLYKIVREDHGAAYSASSYVEYLFRNRATILVYETDDPVNVINYVNEAVAILKQDKCISPEAKGKSAKQSAEDLFVKIDKALWSYKLAFMSGHYNRLKRNSSIANSMALSWKLKGDYRDYLKLPARLDTLTAENVKRAIRDYIIKPVKTCAITAHPVVIEKLKKNHKGYASSYILVK